MQYNWQEHNVATVCVYTCMYVCTVCMCVLMYVCVCCVCVVGRYQIASNA